MSGRSVQRYSVGYDNCISALCRLRQASDLIARLRAGNPAIATDSIQRGSAYGCKGRPMLRRLFLSWRFAQSPTRASRGMQNLRRNSACGGQNSLQFYEVERTNSYGNKILSEGYETQPRAGFHIGISAKFLALLLGLCAAAFNGSILVKYIHELLRAFNSVE
jgi:hypothetical protein